MDTFTIELADALTVACPKCDQPAGSMCVYVPIAMADPNSDKPSVQARLARVGTPTMKAHPERREVIRDCLEAQQRAERLQRRITPPPGIARRIAIYRAEQAWDKAEREQLYEWLRRYGRVLWQTTS